MLIEPIIPPSENPAIRMGLFREIFDVGSGNIIVYPLDTVEEESITCFLSVAGVITGKMGGRGININIVRGSLHSIYASNRNIASTRYSVWCHPHGL